MPFFACFGRKNWALSCISAFLFPLIVLMQEGTAKRLSC